MHFDNPIFILLLVVAGIFRWLSQRAEEKRKNSSAPDELTRRPESAAPARSGEQTEEERVRRFLEALGQPTSSTPPRKIMPRKMVEPGPVIAHFPPIVPALPPLTTAPPPLPQPLASPPVVTPTIAPRKVASPAREQAIFEVATLQPSAQPKVRLTATARREIGLTTSPNVGLEETPLAARLRTPQGLRDAIIIREIFGAPRSLQVIDGLGGIYEGV